MLNYVPTPLEKCHQKRQSRELQNSIPPLDEQLVWPQLSESTSSEPWKPAKNLESEEQLMNKEVATFP